MAANNEDIEGKTLDHVLQKLTGNLNLTIVLDKLLSYELITSEVWERLDSLTNNGETSRAVRKAVAEIKRNPPGYLKKFVEVLKSNSHTKHLGVMIDEGMSVIQSYCHVSSTDTGTLMLNYL